MNNNLELELSNNLENENLVKEQKSFLQTNLGQTINTGLNIGIKATLPDLIEDEVIEIKDSLLTDGFSAAINTAIDNAVDLGKSLIGIFTGKFENISQVDDAVKRGGLIDSVSDLLDTAIDKAKDNNLIKSKTAKLLKSGKNVILDTVDNNIEENLSLQVKSIEKLNTYIDKWKEAYEKQDFKSMERQYNKVTKELEKILPLEDTITKSRELENIHNLIKNNGRNFNLSNEELDLAKKLI